MPKEPSAPPMFPDIQARTLGSVAALIRQHWPKPSFAAKPYLDAMGTMFSINDNYGADEGPSIVAYFLSNATGWRGPAAREIKTELKRRLNAVKKAKRSPCC